VAHAEGGGDWRQRIQSDELGRRAIQLVVALVEEDRLHFFRREGETQALGAEDMGPEQPGNECPLDSRQLLDFDPADGHSARTPEEFAVKTNMPVRAADD
jgi:hypothetical protein